MLFVFLTEFTVSCSLFQRYKNQNFHSEITATNPMMLYSEQTFDQTECFDFNIRGGVGDSSVL